MGDSSQRHIGNIMTLCEISSVMDINDKENISLDLILDTFLNLILDCKSITNSNCNKYLINFYTQYKNLYDRIYDFRLKYIDFNVLKIIGQGAFGQVQLVRHRQTGNLYALKILNKSQVVTCEGTIFWKEEREIMIKIDCRWIVKLHYAFQDPKRLYMVMDYLPGGNLVNWMSKLEVLLEKDVCFYAAEILLAINGLHQYGFVHRDIKPDNLLFDDKGHMKLADFGSCVKMDPITKFVNCNRAIGTPDYISPEVLLSQSDNTKYGKEVDWWALGVMLYEIFYGEPPFYSDNLINTYGKIMTHEQSLSFPPDDDVSETALDFMKNLICDRSIRLGQDDDAEDIKSHAFFSPDKRKWNWDNIQDFSPPFIPQLENDLDTSYFDFGDDDVDRNFLTQNSQELKSNSFIGENLQFSGFSYARHENVVINPAIKSTKTENLVNNNDDLEEQLMIISKENQINKDNLDKLLIEKRDIENQLHMISYNFKKEEIMSSKLQIDYSELISNHASCQRKIENLEELNHKLSSECCNLQGAADKEIGALRADIEKLDNHLKNSNFKLADIQTEYRQKKLDYSNLESEYDNLQKTCHQLQSDIVRLKNAGSAGLESTSIEFIESDFSLKNDYKLLQSDLDLKLKELHKTIMENKALTKLLETVGKEKEKLKISLSEKELEVIQGTQANKKHVVNSKEKEELISDLQCQLEKLKESVSEMNKKDIIKTSKMEKLSKMRNAEKVKFDQELEEQRNKLSKIITSKTYEIQQMKASLENLTETNVKLTGQVELDKIKQETLVAKINEIIHGKCTTAKEMMISEDMKSGLLGKRSGRVYYQLAKETKKLQSMYDQLQKTSQSREIELRKQIDILTKEKEHMAIENSTLQESINSYDTLSTTESINKRASISTIASSQSSFDSGFPGEPPSAASTITRRFSKMPIGKPPLLKCPNHFSKSDLSCDVFHDNGDEQSEVKLRFKKPLPLDLKQSRIENLSPDTSKIYSHLEVNVKVKGKKMSWEKRFVKADDQYIYFYDQDMVTCHLKLLFSSLVFIRSASSADVIHAKKSEIPRIFQICYDKNESIYLKTQRMKSMSRSNTSINSTESIKSSRTNSSNDIDSPIHHDISDKKATTNRKNSLSRFIPLIGNISFKSKENSELSINNLDESSIFMKGHVFVLLNADGKSTCDICSRALDGGDTKSLNTSSKLQKYHSLNRTSLPSSVSTFQCFHCLIKIHGSHLDSKIFTCKQSVAIQLCRATDDTSQANWIKYLNQFVKSQMNSSTTPGLSTPIIKSRLDSFA